MLKVGLTGGLASGKTFVGEALRDLGCHLIQADLLGHETLAPGGDAYAPVVQAFGNGVLGPDGRIDRKKLAREVFADPGKLALLNSFVHPAVFRREEALIGEAEARDPHGIVVVEAAIMIEAGSYKRYDRVIVAVCDAEQQVERAVKRDGVSRDEALARLARQMPLSEKRKYADYVIDTAGSKEHTLDQVRTVHESLRSLTV